MKDERILKTDVLIIGSGLAGLRAAHKALEKGAAVAIVSKGRGASPWLFGFNAPVSHNDSPEVFFNDTVRSGRGINNRRLASILAEEAGSAAVDLEMLGLRFEKENDKYHLLQPLGCSYPRYLHYKFATGIQASKLLRKKVVSMGAQFVQDVVITDLLREGKQVKGALGINNKDKCILCFSAKAVIIATGGCGRLYTFTTYPKDATGDGYAMAYHAGAKLVDMEFMQFEPCAVVYPQSVKGHPVVTTILMKGGELKNSRGERFMLRYDSIRGEKVQKDELAKAIYMEIMEGRGTPHGGVYFDGSNLPREVIVEEHAMCYGPLLKAGIDLTKELVEVAPSAHTLMGGIMINEMCQTSVQGLYAAGEASGGVHGANRLGGNAGTETLVFGSRAGSYAAEYALSKRDHLSKDFLEGSLMNKESLYTALARNERKGRKPREVRAILNDIMHTKVGMVRDGAKLQEALDQVHTLQGVEACAVGKDMKRLIEYEEINNMLTTAKILITAALTRSESRGVHNRKDFPEENNTDWLKNIVVMKSEQGIKTEFGGKTDFS